MSQAGRFDLSGRQEPRSRQSNPRERPVQAMGSGTPPVQNQQMQGGKWLVVTLIQGSIPAWTPRNLSVTTLFEVSIHVS